MKVRSTSILLWLLALGMALAACRPETPPPPNNPPENPTINFPPTVFAGETVRLDAFSVDPDGDTLQYFWSAYAGEFSDPFDRSTTWTAPARGGSYDITIVVADTRTSTSSTYRINVVESGAFPAGTRFPPSGSDSYILFQNETKVTPPVGEIIVKKTVPGDHVPALPPDVVKVIVALEVTPSGLTFAPPAELNFRLPTRDYSPGEVLDVLVLDEQSRVWLPAGQAVVDQNGAFAVGNISHTSLFVLVKRSDAPTPTSTATATPSPTSCIVVPPAGWVAYTVKPGDTLFSLARLTGTSVAVIQQVNCLPSNIVSAGQLLWLPFALPECIPVPPSGWVAYTVKPGDTLFSLARFTGTTVDMIRQVNCLPNSSIEVGEWLWLPSIPITDTPTATHTPMPTPALTWTPTPTAGPLDLIVEDINMDELTVRCPGGSGTCVTVVSFTVANVGAGNAGAFNIRIVLNPQQSVTVNQPVNGLASGIRQAFSITTPPGGNCFDPDCTVCVTVDSDNVVTESDEGNNLLCETRGG
jgi:LysM repeat protein